VGGEKEEEPDIDGKGWANGTNGSKVEKEKNKKKRIGRSWRKKKKKRWNSVVYPVIYNWKLGTTARPKAICRFHPGESPPSLAHSLPKVIRPSTGIDARFGDSFLHLSILFLPAPHCLVFARRAVRFPTIS